MPLARGEADLVLGSRMHRNEGVMPAHQRFGNLLFAWLLRQRFGLQLTDLGPYRAVRRELLLQLNIKSAHMAGRWR